MSDTPSGIAKIEGKNPLFIKGKCFTDCEVRVTVGEEKTEFYVCMDYLAKLSEYFRVMFFGDFKEKKQKQFEITDETPEDMVCFFDAIDADPNIAKITGDSVELLMRLADKYQCDALKQRLKVYIEVNEPKCESASTILNWLVWSVEYNMPKETIEVCLPGVACLALTSLSVNKGKIGFEVYSKLLEAKLQLSFKSAIICDGKTVINKCSLCGAIDSLPYKILVCPITYNHSPPQTPYFVCSRCQKDGKGDKCGCGSRRSDLYDKCRFCQLDLSSYKDKDQCLCAKKMYKMLLKQIQ